MNIFVTRHIQLSGLLSINYLPIFLDSYKILICSAPTVIFSVATKVFSAPSYDSACVRILARLPLNTWHV